MHDMDHEGFPAEYRDFRLQNINSEKYRHVWLLLFWPVYILRYVLIENLNPAQTYTVIHCALDDKIPFCEGFLIFYGIWYCMIFGMHLYTMFFDVRAFKRYTKFLIIAFSISTAIFLIFPSCQMLRPTEFPRNNLLTELMKLIYAMDTSTNVCPSEHVIGAVGVLLAALHTQRLRSPWKISLIAVLALLVSISTVFLKQHSVLDVLAALPVCAVAGWLTYRKGE